MKASIPYIRKCILPIVCIAMMISCTAQRKSETTADNTDSHIQHQKIYYQDGRFAGWPANNGIWIWGNEILVGFIEAAHSETQGFHTYDQKTARNKYARSLDGGETWTIEDGYEAGQTGFAYDHSIPENQAEKPVKLDQPMPDFTDPGFAVTFMRDNYHNGPSTFYYSTDRGKKWEGPFSFPNLGTNGVGTRTDYIVEGPKTLSAFMNVAKDNDREGRIIYTKTSDGGLNWELVSWVGEEPSGFDIMPSSVRISPSELYTVMRSRSPEPRRDFLKAFRSTDNGASWQEEINPAFDTGDGGSPPALLQMTDGRLALSYIHRSRYGSRVHLRFSENHGRTWSNEITLRSGEEGTKDVGYPRMVQRPDGKLVIIYYWNNALNPNSTPYRYIASTIVDPGHFE